MAWLSQHIKAGWASCPLTQNGCIRIMSQPAYPNVRTPMEIATRLREAVLSPAHQFWPDNVSLLDEGLFDWRQLLSPRQLSDAYLLALAVKQDGVFVTFDHTVPLQAVSGATDSNLVRI